MKWDLNRRYLETRNSNYTVGSSSVRKQRIGDLATREIDTLENLLDISNFSSGFCFSGKAILDLGSGDQFIAPCLKARGADYVPIDYDQADFNVDSLPFPDKNFDIVISLAVIEHITNVSNYMTEIYRILKPGGILYISTPNFRFCYKSFFDDPTHVRPYTEKSIKRLLQMWSYRDVVVFPGVRCKSNWFYQGKWRFMKCALIPFRNRRKFIPNVLTGRSTSIIAIAIK